MFVLTSDILIGNYRVKPNSVTWKSSTSNFTDTCTVVLPLSPFVKRKQTITEHSGGVAETEAGTKVTNIKQMPFVKGDKVVVKLGYGKKQQEVFRGYVLRINFGEKLSIECEGYSYCLREKYFSRSYEKTTLKQILLDLTSGTDIKLSPSIAAIPLANVWFKNATGLKVLDWAQKELCCRVWFDGEYLYAGASQYADANPTRAIQKVQLKVGWNVVSADDLKKQVAEEVEINIVEKDTAGSTKKTKPESKQYSNVKELKVRAGLPSDFLKKAVDERQQEKDYEGYEGTITTFGEPHIWKSDSVTLTDELFPERSGNYFVEAIEGEFGDGGFRRKLKLKYYGKK